MIGSHVNVERAQGRYMSISLACETRLCLSADRETYEYS